MRRPTYSVTIANAHGNVNGNSAPQIRIKPDIRVMGSAEEEDLNYLESCDRSLPTIVSVNESMDAGTAAKIRADLEEERSNESALDNNLQENLLKIGMNKKKKKSSGGVCTTCSVM
jgi:hypothetical protein